MSAKRRAADDLNHENWDADIKHESAGEFRKASNDIIQKRVIRTAKRRGSGSPASFNDTQEPAKNLFSSFGGFKTNSSNPVSDLKSTFSFLKSSPVTTNGDQTEFKKDTNVNPTLSSVSNSSLDSKNSSLPSTLNFKKYPPKLMRLNKEVAEWIKSHVDKDPSCILTPIFRDYERYLKEIENESAQTTDNSGKIPQCSPSTDSATSSKVPTFSFFKPDSNNTSSSTFLSKPDQASLMVNPFTTKQNKDEDCTGTGTKGLSFGVNSQQSSTPSTGFSFGGTKPFTFGNVSAPVSSNAGEKNDGETEAEESDEPPKPDFKPVQEEDAVYSKRCKVFIKKEAGYADLGVGTLYVKPVAGEKHQLIVRADTSLGNILINVLLTSGIPLQRMAKNNVMMICVPNPPAPAPDASTPAPSTVLLRVKTSDEADELLANLEKYRK